MANVYSKNTVEICRIEHCRNLIDKPSRCEEISESYGDRRSRHVWLNLELSTYSLVPGNSIWSTSQRLDKDFQYKSLVFPHGKNAFENQCGRSPLRFRL